MKRHIYRLLWLGAAAFCLFFFSCKKNNSQSGPSEKARIVAGTWKQTDIVLGVPVSIKAGGTNYNFPSGTSMITNPYLTAFGVTPFFTPTVNNTYTFSDSGTYRISGPTDLILPVAGNSGKWTLSVYDAVIKLTNAADSADPHWINSLTSDSLALSISVAIPGLGTAPLNLLLKKQ
ncbi:MAG TPA: hypothetical protein VGM31_12620 [Puia sp.]|jgi:hypothetical protein